MNKYLKEYEELEQILKNKGVETPIYAYLKKLDTAQEFDNCYYWGNENERLTEEQEEHIIDIIYGEYMDFDDDISIFSVTKSVCKILLDCKDYETFINLYENDYEKFRDDFCWYLD